MNIKRRALIALRQRSPWALPITTWCQLRERLAAERVGLAAQIVQTVNRDGDAFLKLSRNRRRIELVEFVPRETEDFLWET